MTAVIEAMATPADFQTLPDRNLKNATCVVFDILRATSTMVTALANGAEAIIPVGEIPEALSWKRKNPKFLLAGEREGFRITSAQSGGPDFDFGNSPREFLSGRVQGKGIVLTTTNGTRAIKACAGAGQVWIGSFLNLRAMVQRIRKDHPSHLILVCSGTHEEAAFEDTLAAGAVYEGIKGSYKGAKISDQVAMAGLIYRMHQGDLLKSMKHSRNGRRLLSIPDLKADVPYCLQMNKYSFVAGMKKDRAVRADWTE